MLDRLWGRGRVFETRDAVIYLFQGYTILGNNFMRKFKSAYYVYVFLMYLLCCILSPIIFNLVYIFERKNMNISQLLTSLQAGMNVWGIPAKIIAMGLSLKHLRNAEGIMAKLDARCRRAEELSRIRDLTMIGNRVVVSYLFVYGIYGLSTLLGGIIEGQPAYSLYTYIIDWRRSTFEYYVQMIIEVVVIFTLLAHQVLNDCYPLIYIYIIRIHMQLLVQRVRRLGVDVALGREQHFEELVLCIVDHKYILDLVDVISPIISFTVFVQFLITAIILGTTMINIFIFADSSSQVGAVIYFMAVLMQISPTCYQATCLVADNEQLPLAIFDCNWIEQDTRFQRMLVFFMQRSQKTITLTAMKLFPITLGTSVNIAKFSFSLYTLIKEMDFGQKMKK